MKKLLMTGLSAGLLSVAAQSAFAQQCTFQNDPSKCDPAQRQVNITGATLFRAFFEAPASTNDFIDVNGDGCFGFDADPQPGDPCFPNTVDQLAPSIQSATPYWIVQHRSVGSLKGFEEFVTFQLCCKLPNVLPTERSTINHDLYFNGNSIVWPGPVCNQDIDGDGIIDATGTPICHCSMDLAIVDVVSPWVVIAPGGTPAWSRKPTEPGYGANPNFSVPLAAFCPLPGAEPSVLESIARDCDGNPGTPDLELNFNFDAPDENTIYDTTIAFVTVVPIANRGVFGGTVNLNDPLDAPTVTYSQLQHHFVTGRMPNGENLAAITRDTGSGTRNAWCNSLGIDPSFGNGDNRGQRTTKTTDTNLGPCHQPTNGGSSSHVENATQQRRLGLGYTGLSGNTSAAADAAVGLYEILNVRKDIAPYNAQLGVRPTVSSILDNADPNYSFTIGGTQTFVSKGDPLQTNPAAPNYMANQNAADYLRNIVASIAAFDVPGGVTDPNNQLSPGQYLASAFFLEAGLDARQALLDPTLFIPQTPNQTLQDYIRATNNLGVQSLPADGIVTPAYGSRNPAGLVPRTSLDPNDPNLATPYTYYPNGVPTQISHGLRLSRANRLQGDFNKDGLRNANDIAEMMRAILDPTTFDTVDNGGDKGQMVADVIIPGVMGDQDGDGLFTSKDIRYFADGLAINPGTGALDRKLGFTNVDTAWAALGQGGNYFGTTIVIGCGNYTAGASRFDVAGSGTIARGDAPLGADGVVDVLDLNYILANFGDWSDLDQAVEIDLSCDMNGDLVVDCGDVREFALGVGACFGDLNLDCQVNQSDLAGLLANYNQPGCWTDGDFTGDGVVNQADLAGLLSVYNTSCP